MENDKEEGDYIKGDPPSSQCNRDFGEARKVVRKYGREKSYRTNETK